MAVISRFHQYIIDIQPITPMHLVNSAMVVVFNMELEFELLSSILLITGILFLNCFIVIV
jgi:hypothetical protein